MDITKPDKSHGKYFILRFKLLLSIGKYNVHSNYCHSFLADLPAISVGAACFQIFPIKIIQVSLHNLNRCFMLTQIIFHEVVKKMLIKTPLHISMLRHNDLTGGQKEAGCHLLPKISGFAIGQCCHIGTSLPTSTIMRVLYLSENSCCLIPIYWVYKMLIKCLKI